MLGIIISIPKTAIGQNELTPVGTAPLVPEAQAGHAPVNATTRTEINHSGKGHYLGSCGV